MEKVENGDKVEGTEIVEKTNDVMAEYDSDPDVSVDDQISLKKVSPQESEKYESTAIPSVDMATENKGCGNAKSKNGSLLDFSGDNFSLLETLTGFNAKLSGMDEGGVMSILDQFEEVLDALEVDNSTETLQNLLGKDASLIKDLGNELKEMSLCETCDEDDLLRKLVENDAICQAISGLKTTDDPKETPCKLSNMPKYEKEDDKNPSDINHETDENPKN